MENDAEVTENDWLIDSSSDESAIESEMIYLRQKPKRSCVSVKQSILDDLLSFPELLTLKPFLIEQKLN